MLRIEEIVGAMDDEFRYLLDGLDEDRLTALLADAPALRRLRPVGVSQAEARTMILAVQDTRARQAAALARRDRRRRMVEGIQARRGAHLPLPPLSSRQGDAPPLSSRQSDAPPLSSRQSEATRDLSRTPPDRSCRRRRRPLLLLAGAVALALLALLVSR